MAINKIPSEAIEDNAITSDSIADVDTTTVPPTTGDALVWDGTNFIPQAPFSQNDFDTAFTSKDTDDLSEGTNKYYTDARVDTHLNQSNPTSGYVLSWNGSDYAWVENTGGIDISSPTEGQMIYYNGSAWTQTAGPVIHYTVTSSGSSAYRFAGPGIGGTTDNPTLYLYKGFTYIFKNTTGSAHPFAFRSSNGGAAFSEGISGSQTGTQTFTVPHDISDTSLVYQCTLHSGMVGNIIIV